MTKLSRLSKSVWTLPICLAFLKLWLTSHLPIIASSASHDNLRYVIMAANLLQPDIPYDRYALMRQPGYPTFIALSYLLGFSLRFSQELLYLAAGFFLAWSFHENYHQKLVTVSFLSLYVLAPGSFHWNRLTLQETLYLPLIVFIVSCLIHLINLEASSHRFLQWSAVLGVGLGYFWNTRPEAGIILPSLAFAYGLAMAQNKSLKLFIKPFILSIGYIIISVAFVTFIFSSLTYFKYGTFSTTDLDSPGFKAAYSRLANVSPQRWKYKVSVPRETRLEIYAVSSTFRKLSGYLESHKGWDWIQSSCAGSSICDDYASGWFFWALRDAVADAGQYKSPAATERFYWQIAHEVETACQSGKLQCKDRRFSLFSFAPDIRIEYIHPFFDAIETLSKNLIDCSSILKLESGEEDYSLRSKYYEKITKESANFINQRSKIGNKIKDKITALWGRFYQFIYPILVGLSLIGLGWESFLSLAYPNLTQKIPFALLWLLFSFIAIRLSLFAYIEATSFPVWGCRYIRPILPLVWMCVAIGTSYLTKRLFKRLDMLH